MKWNVVIRDDNGGVRAEFAITANTPAQALRETARHLVDYRESAAKIELARAS